MGISLKSIGSVGMVILCGLGAIVLVLGIAYVAAVAYYGGNMDALWDGLWVFKMENTDNSISREMERIRSAMPQD